MSNVNSVTNYATTGSLTTAQVTELFPVQDQPNSDSFRAVALVTFAAETLFQSGTTAQSLEIPLFGVKAGASYVSRFIIEPVTAIVFGGGAAATATLLGTVSTKTTAATPVITSGGVVTTNNISAAVSLVTAGGTGTNVYAPGQFIATSPAAVSTQAMIIKPNTSVYLKFNSGGTVAADLTVTGAFRVYVSAFERVGL